MAGAARVASGMMWLVGGRCGNALVSLVGTGILARILTPQDFGVVAVVSIILALANAIFDGAFGLNIIRKRELRPEDLHTTLTLGLGVTPVLMLAIFLVAPSAERFFGFPHLAWAMDMSSIMIPCKAVYFIAAAQLQRQGRFGVIATSSLVAQVAGYIVVAVPLALFGAGLWALVWGGVVAGAVEALTVFVLAGTTFRPALDRQTARDVLNAGFFSVGNMFGWVASTAAQVIVGRTMGATDLGLYSRGWKLVDLAVGATASPLARVLLPSFAQVRSDRARLRAAFLDVMEVAVIGYAILSVLLVLQIPLIVGVTLGPKWGDTVPIGRLLLAAFMPRGAFQCSESFAAALGGPRSAATRQAIYAVLMIGGTVAGLPYGVAGVAAGVSLAITIFYVVSLSFAMRIGGVNWAPMCGIHLRMLLLVALVAAADWATLRAMPVGPLFLPHVVAGSAGAGAATLLLLLAPSFWLRERNAGKLRGLIWSVLRLRPLRPNVS